MRRIVQVLLRSGCRLLLFYHHDLLYARHSLVEVVVLPQAFIVSLVLVLTQFHLAASSSRDVSRIGHHHVVLLLACHLVVDTLGRALLLVKLA